MTKTPDQVREDAYVGKTVRLILTPIAAVIIPILLFIAGAVHGVSNDVQDSSVMIAEIHQEMQSIDGRVGNLEDEASLTRTRLRAAEAEIARWAVRLTDTFP